MTDTQVRAITWTEVVDFVLKLPPGAVYGVPRGGATLLGVALACNFEVREAASPEVADYILDDILDSGRTKERFAHLNVPFVVMVDKQAGQSAGVWVTFPWEHPDPVYDNEDTVVRQLELIGEDPNREGLRDTPKRHLKAMLEMTGGRDLKAEDVLKTTFDAEGYDEVVVLKNIEFTSLCEHHLLPFTGTAAVAYIPGERIVGLSKLARLVEMHARRLQVQERMTSDIASDVVNVLKPRGVAVKVEAHHSCMGCRGVRKPAARMVTSSLHGIFKDDASARAEVMELMKS